MSHNIRLDNVRFKDLALVGQILKELTAGVCVLDASAKTFRTYLGQPNKCDAAIRMPGNHDVGLLKQNGAYVPVFDPYTMSPVLKSPYGSNFIGRLAQEYALREAEYEAAQRGMSATRIHGEKGMITLQLVAAS